VQLPPLLGSITQVKNPIISGTIDRLLAGQRGKPPCELITNSEHFCPDLSYAFHRGFILLQQNYNPVDLLQLSLQQSDLTIQGRLGRDPGKVIVEFLERSFFERIQIS